MCVVCTQVAARQAKMAQSGAQGNLAADASRIHSIGLSDSGEALALNQLKRKFCECAHEAKVMEARVNRIMGLLALLFFEDIPMMVLNLMVVSEFTSNPVAGRSSTPVLLSMTIGNLMASGVCARPFVVAVVVRLAPIYIYRSIWTSVTWPL